MYTVGRVLAVLPVDSIMQYLNQLLMPYVEELQYLVTLEASISCVLDMPVFRIEGRTERKEWLECGGELVVAGARRMVGGIMSPPTGHLLIMERLRELPYIPESNPHLVFATFLNEKISTRF
jgi:hypothetical protein